MNFVDAIFRLREPETLDLLALTVGNPTSERLAQLVTSYRSDPTCRLFALLDRENIVGVIGAHLGPSEAATILHLAVRPQDRRRGHGRRLVEDFRDQFGLRDLVAETDREGVLFYGRCGFQARSLGTRYPGVERFLCAWHRSLDPR